MADSYSYPLDFSWSAREMATVIAFFNHVEAFYEKPKSVSADSFLSAYKAFKTVVPSLSAEKKLARDFENASSYSIYNAVQAVKLTQKSKMV
ncbi:MAG: UPF0223 family protein [Streptococcaceae bacterium]|jgi:uncharacterized protein YktA (UPF0223 family)|nr:UPF0223 family protein [Streptococcaceae bacterium]